MISKKYGYCGYSQEMDTGFKAYFKKGNPPKGTLCHECSKPVLRDYAEIYYLIYIRHLKFTRKDLITALFIRYQSNEIYRKRR